METRKFTFLASSQFLHHHLLWFLISAYAIAAVYPTVGLWIRSISFGDITIVHEKTDISWRERCMRSQGESQPISREGAN